MIRRIIRWFRGHKCDHKWGKEFVSLYTEYKIAHSNCERCGAHKMRELGGTK